MNIGTFPHYGEDVFVIDPDPAVGAVENEYDSLGVVAHQVECLETEPRIFERERVERPDHADIARVVDRGDDFRCEAGGAVEHDEIARGPEKGVHLAQELRADRACLVGAGRSDEHPNPALVWHEERLELVGVERAARLD